MSDSVIQRPKFSLTPQQAGLTDDPHRLSLRLTVVENLGMPQMLQSIPAGKAWEQFLLLVREEIKRRTGN